MEEVLEENYIYKYILTIIKSIYGLVQASLFWFNYYTNTMNLKVVFNKNKTDPCLLYRINELGPVIVNSYVHNMLSIRDKLAFMDTV